MYTSSDPRNTWNGAIIRDSADGIYHLFSPIYPAGSLGGTTTMLHGISRNVTGTSGHPPPLTSISIPLLPSPPCILVFPLPLSIALRILYWHISDAEIASPPRSLHKVHTIGCQEKILLSTSWATSTVLNLSCTLTAAPTKQSWYYFFLSFILSFVLCFFFHHLLLGFFNSNYCFQTMLLSRSLHKTLPLVYALALVDFAVCCQCRGVGGLACHCITIL